MKVRAAAVAASIACGLIAAACAAPSGHEATCSSLSGPFCLLLGLDAAFKPYMTPIDEPSPSDASKTDTDKLDPFASDPKRCFFRHFVRSWMDAGGEANDILSQRVRTSDECEQLCCAHTKCKSYTFWMGHTCFLRAVKALPREDGNSFSANRLQ